jgi:hypothetical protein
MTTNTNEQCDDIIACDTPVEISLMLTNTNEQCDDIITCDTPVEIF